MNLEAALKVPGWMWLDELAWLAEQAHRHQRILEIGSWRGRSARAMADNTTGLVTCVDGFFGSPKDTPNGMYPDMAETLRGKDPDWIFNEFMQNAGFLPNVRVFRAPSPGAAELLKDEKFDFIFIDAGHDYESVKADILAWRPLLSEGGLFSGHDYSLCEGVQRAVDELVPNVRFAAGSIWYES